jgi:hypothetical protein
MPTSLGANSAPARALPCVMLCLTHTSSSLEGPLLRSDLHFFPVLLGLCAGSCARPSRRRPWSGAAGQSSWRGS